MNFRAAWNSLWGHELSPEAKAVAALQSNQQMLEQIRHTGRNTGGSVSVMTDGPDPKVEYETHDPDGKNSAGFGVVTLDPWSHWMQLPRSAREKHHARQLRHLRAYGTKAEVDAYENKTMPEYKKLEQEWETRQAEKSEQREGVHQ
jgi:hypothetical protein